MHKLLYEARAPPFEFGKIEISNSSKSNGGNFLKIIYIENKNGEFYSADKKRRFTRLVGVEAYKYLRSEEGRTKVFFKTNTEEESDDVILVEATENQKESVRSFLNHENYVKKCQEESGVKTVTMGSLESDDEELLCDEQIASDDDALDDLAFRNISIEQLYKAISLLSTEEKELIQVMYLSSPRLSERKMSEKLGVSKTEVHSIKAKILIKLRKLLGY